MNGNPCSITNVKNKVLDYRNKKTSKYCNL